jgi:protein-S-isoprenylcysteine O-methyltransferase Ste14
VLTSLRFRKGPPIRATYWEFRNRAWVFGAFFGVAFFLYSVDPVNAAAACANFITRLAILNANFVARTVLTIAALFTAAAAAMRTWGSAYLHRDIVYASEVKSASLVAGGPYRHVRNPLYFGNLLMAVGVGALASRAGFLFLLIAMFVFDLRLILREESELRASRGPSYEEYLRAVPRVFPSPWPRIPASPQIADWLAGFRDEAWCWAFPLGILAMAITLSQRIMWAVMIVAVMGSFLIAKLTAKRSS